MGRGRAAIAVYRLGWRIGYAGFAAALLALAACTASPPAGAPQASLGAPAKQADAAGVPPAVLREHQRILATYGGVYNDPRLQAMIEQTVERLVAASERPDLHYKVTMLNSQSVNAFALPTGQLYVTRGLIALANDESELASVLAHEMGHVIARHAEIREEQARQADLVSRVVTDVVSDPAGRAPWRSPNRSWRSPASRERRSSRPTPSASASRRAPATIPTARRASWPHMERNSEFKPQQRQHQPARAGLSVIPSGDTRARSRMRWPMPASISRRPASVRSERDRQRMPISPISTAWSSARTRAKALCAAADSCIRAGFHLHGAGGLHARQHRAGGTRRQARRRRGAAARRGAACRPSRRCREYLNSGWIENIDPASVEDVTINGFPARDRDRQGRRMGFPPLRHPFRQRRLPLHFRRQDFHRPRPIACSANAMATFRRMSLAEIEQAKPLRVKIVKVAPGDTVEKLAGRMAVADRAVERFRVLNGLDAGRPAEAGQRSQNRSRIGLRLLRRVFA